MQHVIPYVFLVPFFAWLTWNAVQSVRWYRSERRKVMARLGKAIEQRDELLVYNEVLRKDNEFYREQREALRKAMFS